LGRIGPGACAEQVRRSAMASGTAVAPTSATPGAAAPPASAASPMPGAMARQLSPAVRRLLAEHSLDPASVRGTGDGGRITVADVMREISQDASADPRGNE